MGTGHEHTWFVLTQKIIEKEFALSGSEQNPDITSKSVRAVLKARVAKGAPAPVEAFKRNGADFVVETDLRALVDGMNALTEQPLLAFEQVEREVLARDREVGERATRRTRRSSPSAAPGSTSPTGSPASPRRTASSTRRPGR